MFAKLTDWHDRPIYVNPWRVGWVESSGGGSNIWLGGDDAAVGVKDPPEAVVAALNEATQQVTRRIVESLDSIGGVLVR